jgi:hypothetical protein
MTINTSLSEFSIVKNNISKLIPTWDTGIYTPILLGGNPCCSKIENGSPKNEFVVYGDSSNQTRNAEMNCRYNSSSPIITHGESFKKKLSILPSIIFLVHKFIMD